MMGVIGIALVLLVITGTIIYLNSYTTSGFGSKTGQRNLKRKKPVKEKGKSKKEGSGIFSSLSGKIKVLLSRFLQLSCLNALKNQGTIRKRQKKIRKPKQKQQKKRKKGSPAAEQEVKESVSESSKADDVSLDADLLDGLDLDDSLDIDAEPDSANPEFDNIRTCTGMKICHLL